MNRLDQYHYAAHFLRDVIGYSNRQAFANVRALALWQLDELAILGVIADHYGFKRSREQQGLVQTEGAING